MCYLILYCLQYPNSSSDTRRKSSGLQTKYIEFLQNYSTILHILQTRVSNVIEHVSSWQ